jgi:hypothetical protein
MMGTVAPTLSTAVLGASLANGNNHTTSVRMPYLHRLPPPTLHSPRFSLLPSSLLPLLHPLASPPPALPPPPASSPLHPPHLI